MRLCNQVLGIQGKHNISPKANKSYIQLYPSFNTQPRNPGNHLPQPSKSICYTSYGNTPELPPQYWVASRLSHQQLHKRDFRCRRTKLRYSRTTTIKLWRQHLGAQLPGTLPQNPWQEAPRQCSRHKTIGTIPRYPRDPKIFLVKFEKRRVKTLRQDALPERWGGWEVKRIPKLSDI